MNIAVIRAAGLVTAVGRRFCCIPWL